MVENPLRHNRSLYYQHHQDQGHTMKEYRNLWDHLDHLVREEKLKHLLHYSSGQVRQIGLNPH